MTTEEEAELRIQALEAEQVDLRRRLAHVEAALAAMYRAQQEAVMARRAADLHRPTQN